MPLLAFRERLQVGNGAVEIPKDPVGLGLEADRLLRHDHAPRTAIEQLEPDRFLELLDGRRQR
ncbi:hypothetical protein D3C87_1162500 [compost metagenome]